MAKDNKQKIDFKKRKYATSSISSLIPALIRKMGGAAEARKSAHIIRVMNHWPEIVGAEMAQKSRPLKIGFKKQRNRQTGEQETIKTLSLQTDGALGTVIAMREAIILERLNRLFGVDDFKKLTIEHGFVVKQTKKKEAKSAPKQKLNLSHIDDPLLKERLESLGQAVMNNEPNQ